MKTDQKKHAPGPWAIRWASDHYALGEWEGKGHPWTVANAEGRVICKGCLQGHETEANARLIAAAPELLAALEAMVELANFLDPSFDDDEGTWDAVWQARDAIRKATGAQSDGEAGGE